jgi:hypothetical protein
MTTTPVAASALADLVWALLTGIPAVNHFDGEVAPEPPVDADDRVHAYTVYYPSPGRSWPRMLDAAPDSLAWSFQVTCAGGDRTRTLWCVGKVRAQLTGARLTLPDGTSVLITEATDPGPIRRDDDVKPPRFYVPLLFNVTI